MIGQTISHYQIVSQLGSGGMGVVYAAKDERLGRSVALKFVPDDLAKDEAALRRLRAEARTASSLSHPNICTIYDIDESDGRPFIVMELLKGHSLRERLAARPLRVHEIVDLAIQTADALDYAHGHGIIHRDIKPANLFLSERAQVKIVDFGLAKLVPMRAATVSTVVGVNDLTATGQTLGTVAYMSPEQVTGEDLDGRTDIFSFGVVLYECVTGRQPFTGKTSGVVLSAILNKAPAAPVMFNPDLPLRLQEVINNCLEKDRELRYQSAADLRADLRRIRRDLESGQSKSISTSGSLSLSASRQAETVGPPSRPGATEPVKVARPSRRLLIVALPLALAALVAVGGGYWYLTAGPTEPAAAPVTSTPDPLADTLASAAARLEARDYRAALAQAESVLTTAPDRQEAVRIRDQARDMLARFDEAVARARTALDAGNLDEANAAIASARSIEPAAPVVGELSARLIAGLRTQASAARAAAEPARRNAGPAAAPPSARPSPSAEPRVVAPKATPATTAGPAPAPPNEAAAPQASAPQPPAAQPAAPPPTAAARQAEPAAVPGPGGSSSTPSAPAASAPVAPPASARSTSPPAAPVEDDEAAIRRVIATYARAIESKDVALFRSVKPNTSAAEQQRVEEGFKAVSSQRVAITILGIERRGQDATVRLRRRDTIVAGGRQRTSETEQTMRLTRAGSGWVIREIGR